MIAHAVMHLPPTTQPTIGPLLNFFDWNRTQQELDRYGRNLTDVAYRNIKGVSIA